MVTEHINTEGMTDMQKDAVENLFIRINGLEKDLETWQSISSRKDKEIEGMKAVLYAINKLTTL